MQKLYKRKNPKINLKKKMREVSQSRVVQSVTSRFRTPTTNFIVKTSVAFVVLAALTVLFPTAPFSNCVRQFCCRVGTFIVSWLLGTFFDAVGYSTRTERAEEFVSDNIVGNIHASVGFFYLS
ncbi:putative protein CHAPERONE-LIKE PROTEIN OF POR1 [Helianthus debilis subsp. tardiflorus]